MVPIHSFIHGSTVKRIPLSVIVDGDDDDGEIQMASHSEFWKRVNVKTNASRAANIISCMVERSHGHGHGHGTIVLPSRQVKCAAIMEFIYDAPVVGRI
ncbi:hypothetical protein ACO22_03775 [Paracoccidioides brasiliensis]|uniref:Uncharacterized protein n=1 Tax=Paracoccidioides brasiliensis TaxID=121759 RepID=A0A1D2JFA3_PARBR|nr:hypothetical protein ACO22_03775 [Paracoccidioides brasiliensis]